MMMNLISMGPKTQNVKLIISSKPICNRIQLID